MPKPSAPVTFDHLKSRKQPTTRKVKISMTSDVDEELVQAQQSFGIATMMLASIDVPDADQEQVTKQRAEVEAARERLKKAEEAAEKDAVEFKFRSIGRKSFDHLVLEHPPSDENRAAVERQGDNPDELQWNPDTFPPALLGKSLVSPALTPEQVTEMWESDEWGVELETLFQCCLSAQNSRRVVQVGNA